MTYEVKSINTCNCMEITTTTSLLRASKIAEARKFWGHTSVVISEVKEAQTK